MADDNQYRQFNSAQTPTGPSAVGPVAAPAQPVAAPATPPPLAQQDQEHLAKTIKSCRSGAS